MVTFLYDIITQNNVYISLMFSDVKMEDILEGSRTVC